MKDKLTIHEKYAPAMEIIDPDEARAYFEECVQHNMATSTNTREQAEHIERENLGYFAGYYTRETQERVERLFGTVHPVFGSVTEPDLTWDEMKELGMRWAAGKDPSEERRKILNERGEKVVVYVVVRGEDNEGGSIVGVTGSLESAERLALKAKAHFEGWEEVEDTDDEKEWSSGCDYVAIQKFQVQP